MTKKEAVKVLITNMFIGIDGNLTVTKDYADKFLDAICVAISALLKQDEKQECNEKSKKNVWHDSKKERPEEGRKCYAKSENNGNPIFWICKYTDGHWMLVESPDTPLYDALLDYWAYYEDWDFEH